MMLITRASILGLALASVPAPLLAHPFVTRNQAAALALETAHRGSILVGDLERRDGRLLWSFDISIPGSRNVKVVEVDANSGAVVTNTVEPPTDR
jgi:uncharacterized membrane protein YkoI